MRKALFIFLSAVVTLAQGQTYPSKPIRLIVPFAPGGSSEFVARTVSAEMAKALGQNFVVENKPGGGGNIAMGEVARAEPDGYTLIIGHIGTLAANPFRSQGAGPELRGREQAGRRRQYRDGRGGARRARRLHADYRAHRHARRAPVPIARRWARTSWSRTSRAAAAISRWARWRAPSPTATR